MAKEGIKIPAKHYVGMVRRSDTKLPLAFITPNGEDSAALKRISTVDDWVNSNSRWGGQKALPSMVIDNVPLSGFKLTSDIRSSSYGGVDKWRIEDPRGFELEITSGNLARLLSIGMIDRGEINDQCVWGRDGANNILLSTSTDEYKQAMENTKVAGLKADWKNVKNGMTILLQNNIRGVWLGRMHTITNSGSDRDGSLGSNSIVCADKSLHVIHVDEPINNTQYTSQLLLISSPKLAAIEDETCITESEAERRANELLADRHCSTRHNGYKTVLALTFGGVACGKQVTLETAPVEINGESDLLDLIKDYDAKRVFTDIDDGDIGQVSRRWSGNTNGPALMHYSRDKLSEGQLCAVNTFEARHYSFGSNGNWTQKTSDHAWTPDTKYVNLILKVATKSGNEISTVL